MRTLKTHTIAGPSDYVSELRHKAQRKKSRAFFEYFYITLILSINQTNHNGKSKRIKNASLKKKGF